MKAGYSMSKKETIKAQGTEIAILIRGTDDDFLSLSDIAKYKMQIIQAR